MIVISDVKPDQELSTSSTDMSESNHSNVAWVSNPYLTAATSANTRKAYRSDIRQFEAFGGKLPATPETIVIYLQAFAASLNTRTLNRRLIALKHWHTYQGFPDPTAHPIVIKTMTGITRTHGKPKEKAPALTPDDLQRMVAYLHQNPSLTALRDSAMLQIGFFGALRRSEIVNIHCEHIKWEEEGINILLPVSKTDQSHQGQYCTIPYGNDLLCPIKALREWLDQANISAGPIFRRIVRNTVIAEGGLTPLSVNHILLRVAKAAGIHHAPALSAHSLRRGLATSAARANAPLHVIMRAGRWKQVNTVMEYIEANERFKESAAISVLQNIKDKG